MEATTLKRFKWFWPWQDEKEEAWLEEMSDSGWHLSGVQLPGGYTFHKGEPSRNVYRLDYMPLDKAKSEEYIGLFQDAGWEYIGEMSNWRYWRKRVMNGETAEIFTDNESKIRKYQRLLTYMVFFLALLVFLGINIFRNHTLIEADNSALLNAIYLIPTFCYAVIIPIYGVVVFKLVRRINQLKQKSL